MMKIIFNTIVLAVAFGIFAKVTSKLANVGYYDAIASFGLGLGCYLLVLINNKNQIKE